MLISIIVPTCNRYPMLAKCLAELSPHVQKMAPETYEIIVADDSPGEEQKLKLETDFPGILWCRGPQKGPASNRNSGAKIARGKWLLFIDDDCFPHPGMLAAYLKAITQNPDLRVFEGAILQERPQARMDEEAPINITGGYLWSCNLMIRRDLFFEMDGFCELFLYPALEDVDLRERLKKRCDATLFVPEANVTHPWRLLGPHIRHLKIQVASHRLYYSRHPHLRPALGSIVYEQIKIGIRMVIAGAKVHYRGFIRAFQRFWINFYISVIAVIKPHDPANG